MKAVRAALGADREGELTRRSMVAEAAEGWLTVLAVRGYATAKTRSALTGICGWQFVGAPCR